MELRDETMILYDFGHLEWVFEFITVKALNDQILIFTVDFNLDLNFQSTE